MPTSRTAPWVLALPQIREWAKTTSAAEIHQRLPDGGSLGTFHRWAARNGITILSRYEATRRLDEVRPLAEAGLSDREIGEKLGLTQWQAQHRRIALGVKRGNSVYSPRKATLLEAIPPLIAAGFSASQIAQRLRLRSRNAVLGFCYRNGLTCNGKRSGTEGARARWAKRPPKPSIPAGPPMRRLPPRPPEPNDHLSLTSLPYAEAPLNCCKWLYGDSPPWRQCARSALPKASWCRFHASKVYQPKEGV